MVKVDLSKSPEGTRFDRSPKPTKAPLLQEKKGMFGAGLIEGVSIITTGEALGHELWIDEEFLNQTATAIQSAGKAGVKSRFTHPGMSSDGLGKHLGRINNARVEGSQVIGDLHFAESAHKTPDGDLAEYVATLVSEDPEAAGLSIVFMRDRDAESRFMLDNGALLDGSWLDPSDFKSPDPRNTENYPHARLAELRAADLVDEPAANPDGMFDSAPIARNIDEALAFALGLSEEKPDSELFGVNIDRASAFVGRFLSSRGLSIVTKPTESQKPQAEGNQPTREQFTAELSKFTTKFGAENGVDWFNQGKTYEEGLELHIEALSAREKAANDKAAEYKGKLDSLELGEKEPVATGSQADADKSKKVPFAKAVGAA